MMLDVLVGVVIEGFRVSTKGPDQDQETAQTQKSVAPAPPLGGTGAKNGSSGAGSDSGGDVDVDWDGGTSSGNSVGGDEDSANGESQFMWGRGLPFSTQGPESLAAETAAPPPEHDKIVKR